MQVFETVEAIRHHRAELMGPVALVPTMGALHEGHLVHIDRAREAGGHVIVSIFVNPTQFGPDEDYQRYPRRLEMDIAACEARGADAVFAPTVEQIYPAGGIAVELDVPMLSHELEGAWRENHFAGVCRVVAKLLNIVRPHVMTLGRKDYQQLRVVEAMVRDLAMGVEILEIPTVREPDGLAMSSRNAYLTPEQRRLALGLYKALQQARELVVVEGETDPSTVEAAMRQVLEAHQLMVDYAVVRHPHTLTAIDAIEPALTGGVAALVAARLGSIRLIDNMVLGAGEAGEA